MKICFIEDKSIINHDQYIMRLGELTCEHLNGVTGMSMDGWARSWTFLIRTRKRQSDSF